MNLGTGGSRLRRTFAFGLAFTINVQDIVQTMDALTYSTARENLAATIKRVVDDRTPILITKKRDAAVVMISLEEYQALEETAHLLRSPTNARRLLDSIDALEAGKGTRRKLVS